MRRLFLKIVEPTGKIIRKSKVHIFALTSILGQSGGHCLSVPFPESIFLTANIRSWPLYAEQRQLVDIMRADTAYSFCCVLSLTGPGIIIRGYTYATLSLSDTTRCLYARRCFADVSKYR